MSMPTVAIITSDRAEVLSDRSMNFIRDALTVNTGSFVITSLRAQTFLAVSFDYTHPRSLVRFNSQHVRLSTLQVVNIDRLSGVVCDTLA